MRQTHDPFGADIVTEPRLVERPVQGLNDDAFNAVLAEFARIAKAPIPRLGRDQQVLLVLSPEPGYGKSHLIGRLFQKLDDHATLLYIRPFQDPSSCWISLLEKVVSELDHPDVANKIACDPGELTQLDTLTRRVLLALLPSSDEPKGRASGPRGGALPPQEVSQHGPRDAWLAPMARLQPRKDPARPR